MGDNGGQFLNCHSLEIVSIFFLICFAFSKSLFSKAVSSAFCKERIAAILASSSRSDSHCSLPFSNASMANSSDL